MRSGVGRGPAPLRTAVPAAMPLAACIACAAGAADSLWIAPVDGTFGDGARWSAGMPTATVNAVFGAAQGSPFVVSLALPHLIAGLSVVNQSVTFDGTPGGGLTVLGPILVQGSAADDPTLGVTNAAVIGLGAITVGGGTAGSPLTGTLVQNQGTLVASSLDVRRGSWNAVGGVVSVNGSISVGVGAGFAASATIGNVSAGGGVGAWNIGGAGGHGTVAFAPGATCHLEGHPILLGGASVGSPGVAEGTVGAGASVFAAQIRVGAAKESATTLICEPGSSVALTASLEIGPGDAEVVVDGADVSLGELGGKSRANDMSLTLRNGSTLDAGLLRVVELDQAPAVMHIAVEGGSHASFGALASTGGTDTSGVHLSVTGPGSVASCGDFTLMDDRAPFTVVVGPGGGVSIAETNDAPALDLAWILDGSPDGQPFVSIGTPISLQGSLVVDAHLGAGLAPGEETPLLAATLTCVSEDLTLSVVQPPDGGLVALVDDAGVRLHRVGPRDRFRVVVDDLLSVHLRAPVRVEFDSGGATYDVTRQATWSSSNPAVLAALGGALVRGVAPGRAQLTAHVAGIDAEADVEVAAGAGDPYSGVTIDEFDAANDDCLVTASSLSADGRLVAFTSKATDFDQGPTDARFATLLDDVLVKDRVTGAVEKASVTDDGQEGDGHSRGGVISADGRYVAFTSFAPNLGAAGGKAALVLRDRALADTITLVNDVVDAGVGTASGPLAISDDGRFILFESAAALDPSDTNGASDVYRFDRQRGTPQRVGLSSGGVQAPQGTRAGAMSADGRYIVYWAYLAPPATNLELVLRDMTQGTTTSVSGLVSGDAIAEGPVPQATISADGSHVAFRLRPVPSDPSVGTYVVDRAAGTVHHLHDRVPQSLLLSQRLSLNGDGTLLSEVAEPPHGIRCDLDAAVVATITDVEAGATTVVSERPGVAAEAASLAPAPIARDGSVVVFGSYGGDALIPQVGGPTAHAELYAFRRVPAPTFGDLNGDGHVDAADLAILLGSWGASGAAADLDGDGVVGAADLALLLGAWG